MKRNLLDFEKISFVRVAYDLRRPIFFFDTPLLWQKSSFGKQLEGFIIAPDIYLNLEEAMTKKIQLRKIFQQCHRIIYFFRQMVAHTLIYWKSSFIHKPFRAPNWLEVMASG